MPNRLPKRPPTCVREWMQFITSTARQQRLKVGDEHTIKLAALLTLVGKPTDSLATSTFWAITPMFFDKRRVSRWGPAVAVVPPTAESMLRVTRCAVLFNQKVPNKLRTANYQLDKVLAVMVQVRDASVYILQGLANGFIEPGTLFHANTLKHAQQRYRGALGTLARDSAAQGEELERVIEVVSD